MSKQAISQIEKGATKSPEASTLEPICRKTGFSLHWLMTGKGPKRLNDSPKADSGDQHSLAEHDLRSRTAIPDAAILHEAVTLLLFDLDHGGPRTARSASNLLLDLYRRISAAGGELPEADQIAFEEQARSRGEKAGVERHERAGKRGKRRG